MLTNDKTQSRKKVAKLGFPLQGKFVSDFDRRNRKNIFNAATIIEIFLLLFGGFLSNISSNNFWYSFVTITLKTVQI